MTQDTQQLIDSLSRSASPVKPMGAPSHLALRMGAVLLVYIAALSAAIGHRPDLALQLARPFYLAEILLLIFIAAAGVIAAAYLAFPDQYQYPQAVRLPAYGFAGLVLLVAVQAFLPQDARMVMPEGAAEHGMDCTFCIASVAIIPSLFLFFFLKRGASAYPFLSGVYAVLAASAVGCLLVRLEEANDSLLHITLWHYLPTIVFAALGALIGKKILKW